MLCFSFFPFPMAHGFGMDLQEAHNPFTSTYEKLIYTLVY